MCICEREKEREKERERAREKYEREGKKRRDVYTYLHILCTHHHANSASMYPQANLCVCVIVCVFVCMHSVRVHVDCIPEVLRPMKQTAHVCLIVRVRVDHHKVAST